MREAGLEERPLTSGTIGYTLAPRINASGRMGCAALAGELGVKNGTLLWPVRIAAAGTLVTPGGAMEILTLLEG